MPRISKSEQKNKRKLCKVMKRCFARKVLHLLLDISYEK